MWRRRPTWLVVGVAVVSAVAVPSALLASGSSGNATDTPKPEYSRDTAEQDAGRDDDRGHGGNGHGRGPDHDDVTAELAAANLASVEYQDVEVAEADGYVSTLGPGEGSLGCFEDPEQGGMGVHYLNSSLMDGTVDLGRPEALVYELDHSGKIVGLVAHEYIVPLEAWTDPEPPELFGLEFAQHPVLPLWVLHTWIWKDNPTGVFASYNPTVRLCPEGVPVFGE